MVTTNHGVRAKKAPTLRAYEWIFTHVVMRAFDRVICVCSSDCELLVARGVPRDKVLVHLNGVDRPRVDHAQRARESVRIRREWGLEERGIGAHAICLGLVGRLAPEKRHSYIMRALRELLHERTDLDVHLVVFGLGAMADELAAESRELGLTGHVHWMGYRGTVGAETAGFDLLVSLSFAEGLPINIVEAGWAATSVFATAVDGNLDLMPSSEYGTLVPVEASVSEVARRLASTLSDRERLAETGVNLQRRIMERFSGGAWLERLRWIYKTGVS
jgi:L-malate glycosyltransferase